MKYNIEQYKQAFITEDSAKSRLELKLIEKIIEMLNNKGYTYNNIDEFIKMNSDYPIFLKRNNMNNVINHFDNFVTENDFKRILHNFKLLTNMKMQINDSKINRYNFNGTNSEEFVTIEGSNKTYIINNNNRGLDKKIEQIQAQNDSVQTQNSNENTRRIAELLNKETKTLNPKYLYEINYGLLTDKEQEIFMVASFYQERFPGLIKVDLTNGLIIDENNKIMKIDKLNGKFVIKKDKDTTSGIQTEIIKLDNYIEDFSQTITTVAHEENFDSTPNINVDAIDKIDNMAEKYINAETNDFISEIQVNNNDSYNNTTAQLNNSTITPEEKTVIDEIQEEIIQDNPIINNEINDKPITNQGIPNETSIIEEAIENPTIEKSENTLKPAHQKTLVYTPPKVYDSAA